MGRIISYRVSNAFLRSHLLSKGIGVVLAATILLGISSVAHAVDKTGTLKQVLVDEWQGVRIKMNGVSNFCNGGTGAHMASMATSHIHFDATISMLMAAYLSGQEITIRSQWSDSKCKIFGTALGDW